MARILIVDDEHPILESLEMFLGEKGHAVETAATAVEALEAFNRHPPEVVILDIRLPDRSGLELLDIFAVGPSPPKVLMITAYQDMETTIEAMKRGAYDYIHKPLDAGEIENAVDRALRSLEADLRTGGMDAPAGPFEPGVIVGKSRQMREIFKAIGMLCRNRATALIQGETGTGKELIARTIHRNSPHQAEPFVTMDCSSAVETLLESELFGHEKGSFTGATQARPGKIELAGEGTLFLDEVGELSVNLQKKFLGFLERREYSRVGGCSHLRSRCRIIAATHRNLTELVERGMFRKDLYYRLKVITLVVPPLRERLSDIPDLACHFLHKTNQEMGTSVVELGEGVLDLLMGHPWTGNVRELANVITAAVAQAKGKVILPEEMDAILSSGRSDLSSGAEPLSLITMEKQHIGKILTLTRWNRSRAAQMLGISLPTLRDKIRKFGLSPSSPKKGEP